MTMSEKIGCGEPTIHSVVWLTVCLIPSAFTPVEMYNRVKTVWPDIAVEPRYIIGAIEDLLEASDDG